MNEIQLAYRLNQEQGIKLFMTPELRQSIHILQLSEGDLEEAGQVLKLSSDVMESALQKLQSFDPPGVGGRSLQEF